MDKRIEILTFKNMIFNFYNNLKNKIKINFYWIIQSIFFNFLKF